MNGLKQLKSVAGIAIVAATLTAGLPHAASAASTVEGNVVVSYADLDLARAADVRALYARIVTAAGRVCGDHDSRDARSMRNWRSCNRAAIARAVGGIDSDALGALHEGERGTFAALTATASLR